MQGADDDRLPLTPDTWAGDAGNGLAPGAGSGGGGGSLLRPERFAEAQDIILIAATAFGLGDDAQTHKLDGQIMLLPDTTSVDAILEAIRAA